MRIYSSFFYCDYSILKLYLPLDFSSIARNVYLAACAQLGLCQMGMVAVFLKTNVRVFTMKPCISLGKRSTLTVTPGKYFFGSSIPGSILCHSKDLKQYSSEERFGLHISSLDGSFSFGLNSTSRFPSDVGRWPKH